MAGTDKRGNSVERIIVARGLAEGGSMDSNELNFERNFDKGNFVNGLSGTTDEPSAAARKWVRRGNQTKAWYDLAEQRSKQDEVALNDILSKLTGAEQKELLDYCTQCRKEGRNIVSMRRAAEGQGR